jgi:hypothetical protein
MNFKEYCVQEGFFDTWGLDPYLKSVYKNASPEEKQEIQTIKSGQQIDLAAAIKLWDSQRGARNKLNRWRSMVPAERTPEAGDIYAPSDRGTLSSWKPGLKG